MEQEQVLTYPKVNRSPGRHNYFLWDDFFYEFENRVKLPVDFCQRVIELENDLNRISNFNDEKSDNIIEELAYLYKVKNIFRI